MKVVTDVQKEVTQRFLKAMQYLILTNQVKNKKQFAEEVNYTYNHIFRLERGGNYSITLEALNKLSIKFKINAYWLLTGKGQMTQENEQKDLNQKVNQIYEYLTDFEYSKKRQSIEG